MKYKDINGIGLDQFNEVMHELGWYDNRYRVYPMVDLDEVFAGSASYAILGAFHGRRVGHSRDSFNPYDEYFAYNAYDNLISIPSHYLQEYMSEFESEILEYVNANEIELHGVEEC